MSDGFEDDEWGEVDASPPTLAGDEQQAVHNDRYDEAAWQDAMVLPGLHGMVRRFGRDYDFAEPFLKDLYWLFIKGDPTVRDAAEMAPLFVPNRQLISEFAAYPELHNLRAHTVADPFNTVTAMESMGTEIEAAFKAMQQARQRADEHEQAVADCVDDEQVAALRAANEASATATAIRAGSGFRAAATQAEADATEEAELSAGFGVGAGQLQSLPFAERKALMQRLKGNRLAKFAKLIGQFKAEADAQWRRRVDSAPSEIAGVELGDDLTRLSSAEMLNLAVPQLRLDWMRRYLDRSLLVWRLEGNERQGRGPLVVAVDESGTMTSAFGGVTREAWSKALVLALVDVARRQRRQVVYIGWAGRSDSMFVRRIEGLDDVIAVTEHFINGGTFYEGALSAALGVAVSAFDATSEGRADIVFMSDDSYRSLPESFVEDFNAQRARASVAVHGILIGSEDSGAMRQVCDTLRPITGVIVGQEVAPVASMFSELMK